MNPQASTSSRALYTGIALIGGCCLVLGSPSSLRAAQKLSPITTRHQLPGSGPWKAFTLATMEASNGCRRDGSMSATAMKEFMARMSSEDRNLVARAEAKAQEMKVGQVAPLGFWDPVGLSTEISQGRLLFYREAEVKHGRICMLAVLGTIVGEQFHPLLGGANLGGAAHFIQQAGAGVGLDVFWKLAALQNFAAIAWIETFKSLPTIDVPANSEYTLMDDASQNTFEGNDGFTMKDMTRVPGDFGFDPLGLKPKTEKDLLTLQNKEVLNGRLAMIAAAGIVAQEVVTGKQVFR